MTTKVVDGKGRISLGGGFAGRTVIVDDSDPNRIVITPAVVIPADEAWLYESPKAIAAVRKGLAQAKSGKFAKKGPDLAKDSRIAGDSEA